MDYAWHEIAKGVRVIILPPSIDEVLENNLSPLETSDNNSKQITLITCNNLNSNRIIIEAKP